MGPMNWQINLNPNYIGCQTILASLPRENYFFYKHDRKKLNVANFIVGLYSKVHFSVFLLMTSRTSLIEKGRETKIAQLVKISIDS